MRFSFFFFLSLPLLTFSQTPPLSLQSSYIEIDSFIKIERKNGAYKKALNFILIGKEKAKTELGEQDSIFARYVHTLGATYLDLGQYKEALLLFLQSQQIQEKIWGKAHPKYAETITSLATVYFKTGNYKKALKHFIEAKNIQEKALGNEHPKFASSLNNLATVYETLSQYEKALPLHIRAKDIRERVLGVEHRKFGNSLNNLAILHIKMGNYELALPLLLQAKEIKEKTLGSEHPKFANSLNNLAILHNKMGNYELALPLLIQAKNIQEKALGNEHPKFANTLNNLAVLHKRMGNYKLALPLYKHAKDIKEKILGSEHPKLANSLSNLADLYRSMGEFEKALPLYLKAKNIQEKALGSTHPNFTAALNNLAVAYEGNKDYDKALPLYLHAKEIKEKTLGTEHPSSALASLNLADFYRKTNRYDLASSLFQQVIDNMSSKALDYSFDEAWKKELTETNFTSYQHISNVIISLRMLYYLIEKDDKIAAKENKQINIINAATQLLDKARIRTSNNKDKLRLLQRNNDWLMRSLKTLDAQKHKKKAFSLADENKSVLLLQATKSEMTYRLGNLPDSLVILNKKLRKKQTKLEARLLELRSKEEKNKLRNILNQTNQEISNFVAMIKQEYPKYHQLKYAPIKTDLTKIQAQLDEKTALLEYVIGDSVIHIFCVTKQALKWQKSIVNNEQLTENTKALHLALSSYELLLENKHKAYQIYTKKAHWFYQKLLAPVLDSNTTISHLIIVSDGELGHLPFEAFLVEQAPQNISDYRTLHYLIEDYNLSYNYSATLWQENKAALSRKKTVPYSGEILGIAANYAIALDSSLLAARLPADRWKRKSLSPLPAAREEVQILSEKFQGFFAFDTLASEKTVKAKAADYAVLHFATHGILDAKRPILSSLVLTEDGDSLESNFWQAYEISKMELHTDLVVLSACETGYGKFEKGNGIASLARSFMYAGASSLIISLWQVNDYATSKIMEQLYENLANGLPKDLALKQAKLQYIQATKGIFAHPAFWSPFIMMGETSPIYIKKKNKLMPWGIGGAAFLLGVAGFLWSRQRKKEV